MNNNGVEKKVDLERSYFNTMHECFKTVIVKRMTTRGRKSFK